MSKKYRIHEFGVLVGRSTKTLRRWDKEGRLVAKRSISNQRYYDDSDVRKVLQLEEQIERKNVVYCRVSSKKQQFRLPIGGDAYFLSR